MSITRRRFIRNSSVAGLALAMPFSVCFARSAPSSDEIRIALMLSSAGFMGIAEPYPIAVLLMAIEEVNNKGGINGKKVVPVFRDPASNWGNYARQAKALVQSGVSIFHSCYTSASREALLPIIQKANSLLFYPAYYEGRECTANMIMTGSCPNQQVDNSVPWMIEHSGPNVYLLGSNYIYPRIINKVAKFAISASGGKVAGEKYVDLNVTTTAGYTDIIKDIKAKKPDWVLSNVVAASGDAFMREYAKQGLNSSNMPILSYSMTEPEVLSAGIENCAGHYTSFTYFQTVDTAGNKAFVARFKNFLEKHKKQFPIPAVTSGVMQAAYSGFLMFVKAAQISKSVEPAALVNACKGMEVNVPEGKVRVNGNNLHTALRPRIGRVNESGLFDILDESASLVEPVVFNPLIDPGKTCENGGEYHIKGKRVST
ncbi:transporter substrate-binding domain-containing protein [Thalassomonas viridans]|uniref:Transporter substrate-binding domain-containing protein n=1 Tax=Thalassomonas viridans TaxID=137584 RepID=A0AAF0C7B0_9GAMM|nr:transporter substrate-binding domain-containing protein [Thalassomonas viridans]WDE02985.1 transporter substrate-binding domain-containing protein [Thalassomonas viridans]